MINLYEYQKKYLEDLPPRAIMAADTGTGKTFMALAHYEKHCFGLEGYTQYESQPLNIGYYKQPLLILAPASKVRTGDWQRDITEYFGAGNEPQYEIYSYEKFSRNPTLKQFGQGKRAIWHKFAPQHGGTQWAIIADECHKIKNPQSGIGKAIYQVAHNAQFFVGLSATPLPNGWIDFAGYSKVFGFTKNVTEFKKRYCNIQTYKGFPEIVGYWHEAELTKQWQSISKKLTKAEANELPDRTFVGVSFNRPKEYLTTILDRVAPDGTILDSAPLLTNAIRQTLTAPKLGYLSDLLEGTNDNVVIFYNYISERKAILEMIAKSHKDKMLIRQDGEKHEVPPKEAWANIKNSVTVAHYKSGGTGVEMTYANITVYFSPTYSYAEYIQSIGRTHRNGQTKKTTFYNFRTSNTIEEDIYDALRNKRDFQEKIWYQKEDSI